MLEAVANALEISYTNPNDKKPYGENSNGGYRKGGHHNKGKQDK